MGRQIEERISKVVNAGPEAAQIQAREVMVDFAFMNLSLKERPRFYTECDMVNETITEKALMPKHFELGGLDFALRGRLLRHSLGESMKQIRVTGKAQQEIERAIERWTLHRLVR